MDAGEIKFDRTPYTVKYKDMKGDIQSIRRRPPPKLHDMLPQDEVKLTRKKNDDWLSGHEFTVKHINPRHPNTLQIEDDDGKSTFVSFYDLNLERRRAARDGVEALDLEVNNDYLLWP